MRYKLAFGAGFASGYYLGTKAGRQRYEQINRTLDTIRRSPKVEAVTDKARAVIDEKVDRAREVVSTTVKSTVKSKVIDPARSVVPHRSNGSADGSANGTATIPSAANPSDSG